MAKRMIRSKDAAHILDMCPDDVIALARKGKLPGEKTTKGWRFAWTDVTGYRRRNERRTA